MQWAEKQHRFEYQEKGISQTSYFPKDLGWYMRHWLLKLSFVSIAVVDTSSWGLPSLVIPPEFCYRYDPRIFH